MLQLWINTIAPNDQYLLCRSTEKAKRRKRNKSKVRKKNGRETTHGSHGTVKRIYLLGGKRSAWIQRTCHKDCPPVSHLGLCRGTSCELLGKCNHCRSLA
uniref:Uncharacterized protein n=1 Tax=Arundo donax TaxID=35708 RepID=A0A0A9EA49_ARUDO